MCGLSAIIELEPDERLLESLLAMHECIPHRGPDGEGFTTVDGVWQATSARSAAELRRLASRELRLGLAFRWLQIQDPGEAAAQPMASRDGSVWLMFNGEIYNFQEIRRELEQHGHRFTSASDTEVILAAYLQWGSGCFSRLNGMWAMVLLDLRARKIVVSRDRFGIKPLFYYLGRKRLIIASEIKQLIAAGAPAIANRAAVTRFIRGLRPATPEQSFFQDILAQPAATFAEISLQTPAEFSFVPYWHLDASPVDPAAAPPLNEACNMLDELLTRSVAEHMVAQAPLGHLISGGLDSSLLAALAAPNYSRRGRRGMGASMVLTAGPGCYDETTYIDQVVTALKFESFRAELSSASLKADIDRITKAQEEPVAGMAVAGQFLAYQTAARHGARVVLDGQGADEIFAGYPRHQYTVLRDYLRHRAVFSLLRELTSLGRGDARFFLDIWRSRIVPRLARGLGLGKTNPAFLRPEGNQLCAKREREARHVLQSGGLTEELLIDVLAGNLRPALAVTDRNAMAHSIEARVPYVDRRIIEFAFQLPDCYKIGDGQRKRVVRLLAERYLPKAIVSRVDRIGFGAPIEQWLKSDFHAELSRLADGDVFRRSTLVDRSGLGAYLNDFLSGQHHDSGTVWRLYAIDVWARVYAVTGI
jgi:asparagine synthase (glutamine-hydrolysing)